MADDRAYRVIVTFDPAKERFLARVPELEMEAAASSRAEAMSSVEQELEARIDSAAQRGESVPAPTASVAPSEPVLINLASPIAQDLAFHAARLGLSVEALAVQLLAQGVGRLEGLSVSALHTPRERERERERGSERDHDRDRSGEAPRRPDDADGNRPAAAPQNRRKRREGYHGDLENKANFMDYVRNLERGGGRGRR